MCSSDLVTSTTMASSRLTKFLIGPPLLSNDHNTDDPVHGMNRGSLWCNLRPSKNDWPSFAAKKLLRLCTDLAGREPDPRGNYPVDPTRMLVQHCIDEIIIYISLMVSLKGSLGPLCKLIHDLTNHRVPCREINSRKSNNNELIRVAAIEHHQNCRDSS